MKSIGFVPNATRDIDYKITRELITFVSDLGFLPLVSAGTGLDLTSKAKTSDNIEKESDFLVVLGGDGTILNAAKTAALYDTPLLGVNVGKLGYLTNSDKTGAKDALVSVFEGKHTLERRMMLEIFTKNENYADNTNNDAENAKNLIALNEVSIERGYLSKMMEIDISINNEYMDTYNADGVIICTPTGSTAYNLSAGGPILKPDSEMIGITPICPHALYVRPLVVSSSDIVKIKISESVISEAVVSLDGVHKLAVKGADEIFIKRSNFYTTIIKTGNYGFYDILRTKMMGCERNK